MSDDDKKPEDEFEEPGATRILADDGELEAASDATVVAGAMPDDGEEATVLAGDAGVATASADEEATVLASDPGAMAGDEATVVAGASPGEEATVLAGPDDPTMTADDADADAATQIVSRRDAESSPESPRDLDSEIEGDTSTRVIGHEERVRREQARAAASLEQGVSAEAGTEVGETRNAPRTPPPQPSGPNKGIAPGTILFGEYEVLNVLGVGGMGEVYRARHRRLNEHRAIKVMHPELSNRPGAAEFFDREAKALLAVRHPAVVHCHDLLSDDQGNVYLIMEMIEGIPLSKKLNDGPMSPDDVAVLGARVAAGLTAAHKKGVIHRDISPDNIVLPDGLVSEAKVIDFGIAKLLEEGQGTIVDGFKGKLSYASPEQLGFFGGKIDGRSDFYSLGLVLVAAARGKPMGMGTTVMEAVDARRSFESVPDDIPIGLRSAIQPLLALDPDDRPKYVERLFVVPGAQAPEYEPGIYGARTEEKKPEKGGKGAIFGLVGGGALLAVGATAFFLMQGPEQATTPSATQPSAATPASPPTGTQTANATPSPPTPSEPPTTTTTKPPTTTTTAAVAKPAPRKISSLDRVRMIGLMRGAEAALADDRLMSPAGDNAYEKYEAVLKIDPGHADAKAGLTKVAGRYLQLAESSIDAKNYAEATTFVDRAAKADPRHPKLAAVRDELRASQR